MATMRPTKASAATATRAIRAGFPAKKKQVILIDLLPLFPAS